MLLSCAQVGFSVVIFVLLASEDGFSREWVVDEQGIARAPSLYNGAFSTIAFLLGAITSIISGFLGAGRVQSGLAWVCEICESDFKCNPTLNSTSTLTRSKPQS